MWTGYYSTVKKANRRVLRSLDRLENARNMKQQIVFYKEALNNANRLIHEINHQPIMDGQAFEDAVPEPFIAKFRKKAEDYLNRIEACRPQPANEKIERLDYHTSKRY